MAFLGVLLGFLITLIISALIVYLAAKLLGEKEGFGTAVLTAISGTIIFALAFYFIGIGWIAALTGGVVWLIALGSLYDIGWLKSLAISAIIWIFVAILSLILPTIAGPL